MIVNLPRPTRPASAGECRSCRGCEPLACVSAVWTLLWQSLLPVFRAVRSACSPDSAGRTGTGRAFSRPASARRPLSARVQSAAPREEQGTRIRPTSAHPRMQAGGESGHTRVRCSDGRYARAGAWEDLSSVVEQDWDWEAREGREPRPTPASLDQDKHPFSPPPVAQEHRDIMQVAESSLATAHAALRHTPSFSGLLSGRATEQPTNIDSLMEFAAARPRRRLVRKKSKSPERDNARIAWAASNALVTELEEARELLRDPQHGGDSEDSVNAYSPVVAPSARPARRGPTTPPLLQRPIATDYDEDTFQDGRREYVPSSADALPAVKVELARKGGKGSGRSRKNKMKGLKDSEELLPSSMRKDALKRSVEAIESLSLALDSVNEEKKVLLRVLEACKTAESVTKSATQSESAEGRGRLAQACYIAQMLPGVDSKVVERMPAKAVEAIEAALALKLAHAQSAAKLVEMQIRSNGSGMRTSAEPSADKMQKDLEQLRAENEQLRLNLMESTQGLLARGSGAPAKGNGPAMVISFLQKDIAAAKAKILVLQTEAASSEVHARRVAEKAEEDKEFLRREISSLHARLEALHSAGTHEAVDDASATDKLEESADFSRVVPASSDISLSGDTQNTRGISAAASVRFDHESGSESAVASSWSMLGAALREFSAQLANNYSQVRSALHGVAQEHNNGPSVVDLVKRLLSLISSFDAQISYLQTTEGALSLRAKQQPAAAFEGNQSQGEGNELDLGIARLVQELDRLCVEREMRRQESDQPHQHMRGAGARMAPHAEGEEDWEESGVTQGAESKAGGERDEGALLQDEQDMLSTSFSGERMGRGGELEMEAWREAGRAEALRMIESAQVQAREYRASSSGGAGGGGQGGAAPGEVGAGQGQGGAMQFKLEFEALGLGDSRDSRHASQPDTPRSHTHTPRQRPSPRSQDTGTPRSSGLVENARSLRAGGLASQHSPRVILPSEDEDGRADSANRPERGSDGPGDGGLSGGRASDHVGFTIDVGHGAGRGAGGEEAREGGGMREKQVRSSAGTGAAARLSRQRTVPKLEEADDTADVDGEEEGEGEGEGEETSETNESGSLLESRLDVLLVGTVNVVMREGL